MSGPLPQWSEQTCVVCPAQQLGPGAFDVVDRPGPEFAYDPDIGWRVNAEGIAICVHPYRVGLPAGRYASRGEAIPVNTSRPAPTSAALQLPADVVDLEGWLVAVLRDASPEGIFAAVSRAERLACERFAPKQVVAAMRRVLSVELANR